MKVAPRVPHWILATLLNSVLIQASTYLTRPMISYKLLSLHASNFVVGSFGAIYALFPLLIAIPLGRWINHYGEGRFIALGTALIAASTLSLIYTSSIIGMVCAVAVLGSSQLLCMAGAQALFANRSPKQGYEQYFGYYTFSAALGQLIGPLIGTAVSGSHGVLPTHLDRAFLAGALLALLGMGISFLGIPLAPSVGVSAEESRAAITFTGLLANPGMKVAMFASLAISSSVDVLVVFLPVFGKERGFSAGAIGIVLALRAASSMLSRIGLGKMTERIGYARLLISSIAISTICCVVAIFSPNVIFLAVIIALAGLSLGVGQPMTMAWVSRRSKDEERSYAISVRLAGNRLGQFLLPATAGLIAGGFGASAVFFALAVLMGSSGLLARGRLDK